MNLLSCLSYSSSIKSLKYRVLRIIYLFAVFLFSGNFSFAQEITVNVDHPTAKIQPTMWGLFFEDINFAADGGLYAELVKNRSFEFPNPKTGWDFPGQNFFNSSIFFINRGEESNNQRFARMDVQKDSNPSMINTGFRGIGLKEGEEYRFSIWTSVSEHSKISLKVELLDSNDSPIGEVSLTPTGNNWKKYEAIVKSEKTDAQSKLKVTFEGEGSIDFDMVSLFPVNTWNGRKNGLRADLVQLLVDMKPGFFRFPGGCIVEGRDLEKRYQWKETVGNIEDRGFIINRWNDENSRLTPDYFQSFGLGFYEYFLLCEDIGAEPVPVINCGMACQFNTAELVPLEDLDPYIQDAMDLIEFANGPVESKWGKLRAEMGHPEPFKMKYIGVGNEQWGTQYFERYQLFEKAILDKYSDIQIISTTGPFPTGPFFDLAEKKLKQSKAALVDEHYYNRPEWFFENVKRYDNYDRDGYKIFVGEYAAASDQMASPENKNTWECALAEAAFMTGLERNADVVSMASYAPLLAHVDAWQWTPDLIWFDNLTSYGTPSYYVQKMYANNKGTDLISMVQNGEPLTGQNGIYGSAVVDSNTSEIIIKIVNSNKEDQAVSFKLNSKRKLNKEAKLIGMTNSDLKMLNTINQPETVVPIEQKVTLQNKKLNVTLGPNSFYVIKIRTN